MMSVSESEAPQAGSLVEVQPSRLAELPISDEGLQFSPLQRPSMNQLQLTLDTAAENIALDEALLEAAEALEITAPVLRLWESEEYFVVLGRSGDPAVEVNLTACQQDRVPVLRRSSGGGTVLAGPGCLMYAVVLDFATYPQAQAIDGAHQFVLGELARMLSPLTANIEVAGISDLVIAGSAQRPALKFSGNAMRRKRRHLLYHGTLLYDFDLPRISRLLGAATRTPEYRGQRSHAEFVTNLPVSREQLQQALLTGWRADQRLKCWPTQCTAQLVREKYVSDPKWILQRPTPD